MLSPRVVLEVPVGEGEPSRRWPWWWFAVAGLVVVVLAVVIVLVATGGDDGPPGAEPSPSPAPTATAPPTVIPGVMPMVVGLTETEALRAVAARGIVLRSIQYQHNPEQVGLVVSQRVGAGEVVDPSRGVTLVVGTELPAPVLVGPVGVLPGPPSGAGQEFEWDPGETVADEWVVTVRPEQCAFTAGLAPTDWFIRTAITNCQFTAPRTARAVDSPSTVVRVPLPGGVVDIPGTYHTGWYEWYVEAVDSFGNRGPRSQFGYFRIPVG